MKYAYLEETEIIQVPEEDENGDPIVPENLIDKEVGTGNGIITGINRAASNEESEGNITPQHLTLGMDNDFYTVIDYVFTPKSQVDVDIIIAGRLEIATSEDNRRQEIETEQSNAGLRNITLSQANNFIDTHIDNITDLASAKEEMRIIFKKMIPYILQ